TSSADAFGIAFMIPNLFRRLFAENSISVAFIPTFKGYIEDDNSKQNHETIQQFVSSTLTLFSFFSACVVVLGMIFTPLIIPFFYDKGVSQEILNETSFLTRLMFPYLFVISVAAFFQGILNGCNIFAPSGFTPVLFNAIVIAITYALTPVLQASFPNLDNEVVAARAMSFGVITGGCFQALFQWPFIRKTGWKTTVTGLKKAFTNPGTKKVVMLIVPTIIGMAAYQLNDLVSTAVAGKIGEGVVSSLQYSLRLQELILGIFAVSIGTVILPDLSALAKRKEWENFNSILIRSVKIIALITIPVTFYSLVCGKDLISLIYKTNKFDDNSVLQTLNVFVFHIAGLFFIALNRIISPAFYAQGNTKLPTLAGTLSFAFNILFVMIFAWPFKTVSIATPLSRIFSVSELTVKSCGIAFSLSLSSLMNTIFLFIFMKKMPSINVKLLAKNMIIYIVRMISFSVIAAVPVYFLRPYLLGAFSGHHRFISYGVPVLISALVFALIGIFLLFVFKDENAQVIKDGTKKIFSKFKKSKNQVKEN
ncbi:MAG: murein biosynthesis integral membrane protein MurJ, partial [Spirochaetia bacterium]|nr:murein biosynthesis integral membrane protein MurJ [Spirochaetia bacterium]